MKILVIVMPCQYNRLSNTQKTRLKMSVKIIVGILFFVVLLAITIFTTSCINYLSTQYECYQFNKSVVSPNSVDAFLWAYVATEFIIALSIGVLIGLCCGNKNAEFLGKSVFSLIIIMNILKLILFSSIIILYKSCVTYYSQLQLYLIVFFMINIVTLGLGECVISSLLIQRSVEKNIVVPVPLETFTRYFQNILYLTQESPRQKEQSQRREAPPSQRRGYSPPDVPVTPTPSPRNKQQRNQSMITMPSENEIIPTPSPRNRQQRNQVIQPENEITTLQPSAVSESSELIHDD